MNTQLNFTDRASYIAWRSEWRASYAALSEQIRLLKLASKSGTQEELSRAQSKLSRKSAEATAMLKQRAKSKALSAAQREAAQATERAAA
mgnify:CR=1 FL=1